nr:MAG: major capsid protein [Microviridae sp.]
MNTNQAMVNSGKQVYSKVSGLNPGKSVFDLSYEKKFTCDMGQLIPVLCEEMVPGDHFKVGNQAILRFQPLVAPIMHEINMYVHYYFVPYRLLWEDWEKFITGGKTGDETASLPTWTPTPTTGYALNSLWDYLGFPVGISPTGMMPLDFPRRAYNFVYNEFYRDETLITEVALTNEAILNRCWEKDYFTSSLPWQQRGTAPALPISGITHAVWDYASIQNGTGVAVGFNDSIADPVAKVGGGATARNSMLGFMNANQVDLSSATTFNVADLRLAFQVQKFLERNARAGARYTEFLQSHFGVSPRDERLQRPEYIGGSKSPIIISEVLQTSQTDTSVTPQGNMAGHGVTVSQAYCGKYTATEFGLIIGLMSVMPRSNYQQGINRQWLRRTKYDFYFPEFAHLSEQAILKGEILAKADSAHNNAIFGYQGRYDELRTKQNLVCGEFRTVFDYWHLGRVFDPATPPELNASFVECVPSKRIFAVQDVPGLMVQFGNLVKAFRPLPIASEPGLIDHS